MGTSLFRQWGSLDRCDLARNRIPEGSDVLVRVRIKFVGCVAVGWASDGRIIEEVIPADGRGEVVLHCKSMDSMTLELRAGSHFPAWGKTVGFWIEEKVPPAVLFPRKKNRQRWFGDSNLLFPSIEYFEYCLYQLASLLRLPFPFRLRRKLAKAWARASRLRGYEYLRTSMRAPAELIRPQGISSYPTISKEVIRANPMDFVTGSCKWESGSSGSSGEPFRFFHGDSHQRIMYLSNIAAAQYGLNLVGERRASRF